jgi:gliding motility-associated-like protein
VTNATGCTSTSSANIIIPIQPVSPATPVQTSDCSAGAGKAVVRVTSPTGTGLTYRIDGGTYQSSTSFSNVSDGSHNITVRNSEGCTTTGNNFQVACVCINPPAPIVGLITQPSCNLPTGRVTLSGLPSAGTWTLTRYPGTVVTQGSGQTVTLSGIQPGLYNYTVTNEGGCISGLTANVLVPAVPNAPSAPAIGTITQPTQGVPTGSVILNNLPGTGSWTLNQTPGNITIPGSGSSVVISGLQPGVYNFRVTNTENCISGLSEAVTIVPVTVKPLIAITLPAPVCFPATVDITDPRITAGSTPNLILTYWTDVSATIQFTTPKTAAAGTWYIKGTMPDGTSEIKHVIVTVYHNPVAKAGADQVTSQTTVQLDADPINDYETGLWSVMSGSGTFFDPGNPKTSVNALSEDKNIFLWQVTNGVCPVSLDTVMIILHGHLIPSLITPNMDGRNDFLVIKGFNPSEKIELIVFDRRGVQVFKSENYDNQWNGIDMYGKPLEGDTYFYVLRTAKDSQRGYLVIKR